MNLEFIHNKFKNQFEDEGYHFLGSLDVYIPFYETKLYYKYYTKDDMSIPEKIICDCINRGIHKIEDLSFILSIDLKIMEKLLEQFIVIDLLYMKEGEVYFTKDGENLYKEGQRPTLISEESNGFYNLVTGEWNKVSLEELVEYEKTQDGLVLDIKNGLTLSEQQEGKKLKVFLQTQLLNDEKIEEVSIGRRRELFYQKEVLLLYMNNEKDIQHLLFNPVIKQYNPEGSRYIQNLYSDQKLKELEPIQKMLRKEQELIDSLNKKTTVLRYVTNREIRNITKNLFTNAKESIHIISPWLGTKDFVLTDDFLDDMENALNGNKIKIHIMYGYTSKRKLQDLIAKDKRNAEAYAEGRFKYYRKDNNVRTEEAANRLRKRFNKYSNFAITHHNTHEKVLCYDGKYCVVGSYNYLSYDGGEIENYYGYNFRKEGAVYIEDEGFVKDLVEKILRK